MVPTAEHYDVVVIGGGPGGYATALYGASAGLNIAMIEKGKLGGTCLNVGCIPAKELLETAATYLHVNEAGRLRHQRRRGRRSTGAPRSARKDTIVDGLVSGLGSLLKSRKVTVLDGHGRLHAGKRVTVSGGASGDLELTGDAVVLAPGSVPRTLPGFDVDGTVVMTSDEFLSIAELPKRAAIIGGGVIGCEFASMLRRPRHQGHDPRGAAEDPARPRQGPHQGHREVVQGPGHRDPHRRDGRGPRARPAAAPPCRSAARALDVDVVVVSVGRRPNTDDLGLDGTGVMVSDRGFIEVDEGCRTGEPGVWAVGDAIATPALAHIGFIEGIIAIQDILGEDPAPVDYGKVPVGASTAGPRRPSPGCPRRRPRRPASTSSPRRAASTTTAGRRSSTSPRAW